MKVLDLAGLKTFFNNIKRLFVPATRTVNGKALSTDVTLDASDVGADISGSASSALSEAKTYTDNTALTKQDKLSIGDGLQLVDGVLSVKKKESVLGWEYIGEFSPTSTLTFESDKYKMFWVRAWYTRTAGANNYIRLHIDKDVYLPWTSFNYTQFSVAGLFFRKASLSLQVSSQAAYLTNTTRGNGTLEMASPNSSSLSTGTAFFAGSTEHLIDWKIELWGMI